MASLAKGKSKVLKQTVMPYEGGCCEHDQS